MGMTTSDSRITGAELKSLTGEKTVRLAIYAISRRLEKRNWRCQTAGEERSFCFSGLDWDKGFVLLYASWSVEGGAGYRFARLPIGEAIDCVSGHFSSEFLR